MTQTVYFECPKCFYEHTTEFDIGDHFCDIGECEDCGHKFTPEEMEKLCTELEIQAIEQATESAMSRYD